MTCLSVCTQMYGCGGLSRLTSPALGTGVPEERDVFTTKNASPSPRGGAGREEDWGGGVGGGGRWRRGRKMGLLKW